MAAKLTRHHDSMTFRRIFHRRNIRFWWFLRLMTCLKGRASWIKCHIYDWTTTYDSMPKALAATPRRHNPKWRRNWRHIMTKLHISQWLYLILIILCPILFNWNWNYRFRNTSRYESTRFLGIGRISWDSPE